MREILDKTDGAGDILSANAFNTNFIDELQEVVSSAGFTMDIEAGPDTDTEMFSKSLVQYAVASQYFVDSGAANAYVLTRTGNLKALSYLVDGVLILFKPVNDNTGASTINVDGLGVKDLVDAGGSALTGGELTTTAYTFARYNSSTDDFEIVAAGGGGGDASTLNGQPGSYYLDASNINAGTIGDAYLPASISSDITGNAATASSLAVARNISLSGDITGSTSFDGGSNVTITATVVDDSHNHVISNVDNLQSSLDAKANDSTVLHLAGTEEITGEKNINGNTAFIVGDISSDGSMRLYYDIAGSEFSLTPYSSSALVLTKQIKYSNSLAQWDIEGTPTVNGNEILHTGSLDFEESTFTPTIVGTSVAGTGTYAVQAGSYQKIGNWVFLRINIGWTAHSGTGNLTIANLPYTSNATGTNTLSIMAENLTYSGNYLAAFIGASSSSIALYNVNSASNVSAVSMDTIATLYISGGYEVA